MVDRICISINNRCNLNCKYCHFHEKKDFIQKSSMDVLKILDNVIEYINKYNIPVFKIGFVGNGEPLLEMDDLKKYIIHIGSYLKSGRIKAYTITNGLLVDKEKLEFFKEYNFNVGFSIDGIKEIHDKYRCNSFDKVLEKIELYYKTYGEYPTMNCTVGADVLKHEKETIDFFKQFNTKITFSRMIGKYGISLSDYKEFINNVGKHLNIRYGGYDCTMYGGKCAVGINNYFFANGKVYICGNCVDLESNISSDTKLDEIKFDIDEFNRKKCFKEEKNS